MINEYIAHARKDDKNNDWIVDDLDRHCCDVAQKAKEFADIFQNGDWGYLVGLWHDLGKYLPEWQKYIRKQTGYEEDAHIECSNGRPNHSTAGAVLAFERFKQHPIARILAYVIAGHHAGLPDWDPDIAGGDVINRIYEDPLSCKLDTNELDSLKKIMEVQEYLTAQLPRSVPSGIKVPIDMKDNPEIFHLWIRMLFSCLVDADFLDTEEFMNPDEAVKRGQYPELKELSNRFNRFMASKFEKLKQANVADTAINQQRRVVLEQCRTKSKLLPGFFSLTVPTGGGKTLSSMAFALNHAIQYSKKRIIMAIPYTSIIEQTSKVFKYGTDDELDIKEAGRTGNLLFGEDSVLEHHSNLDPDKEDSRSRLASENWDAPIIITTNVQLFESLFASRTSSCRKLHNIVNSVIVLDEAQMLPPEYLKSVISVLKGLVEYFGVTVLMCTATQPSLCGKIGRGQAAFEGFSNVTEIIDHPEDLAQAFKRIEFTLPKLDVRLEWKDIAVQLVEHEQILCIVNTRKDCRDLHALMPQGTIHLSANMCGEERSEVISDIRQKLKDAQPIRVISTQLVEAGVDIDFPVVYRALAGIDSIAQAAGRCNREGKLNTKGQFGKVVVFQPQKPAPVGLLRKGEDAAKTIIRTLHPKELTPSLYTDYFNQYYLAINDFDKPKFKERLVQEADEFKFQFRTIAQDFHLIDDTVQQSIIVWYKGRGRNSFKLIEYFRNNGTERWVNRKLQRFIVNVPLSLFNKLRDHGYIEEVHGYWVQKCNGLYSPGRGLIGDSSEWDAELFVS